MDKNKVIIQIIFIKNTGLTNMFDTLTVKQIAKAMDFKDLVAFIDKDKKSYCSFILTGKFKYKGK